MTTGRSNADIVIITMEHSTYEHARSKSHIVKCKDYYAAVVAPLVVNTTTAVVKPTTRRKVLAPVVRVTTSRSGEQQPTGPRKRFACCPCLVFSQSKVAPRKGCLASVPLSVV